LVHRYEVLVHPGVDRLYGPAAATIMRAEARAALGSGLDWTAEVVDVSTLGGATFVAVESALPIDATGLARLARLSFAAGAFERSSADGLRILPDEWPTPTLPRSLLTIQRYKGKTNEFFTRLLVNLAVSMQRADLGGRTMRMLDPVAGRGTTLNAAALDGLDATGIEINRQDFEQYSAFISRWMQDNRVKHRIEKSHVRGRDGERCPRVDVSYGTSKAEVAKRLGRTLTMINGDAADAHLWFGRNSFEAIVADLPYGVQHVATSGDVARRSPRDLVAALAPGWHEIVRPGGVVVLAYNTFTLGRDELAGVLGDAGWALADDGEGSFLHDVDASIKRDVTVAHRPAAVSARLGR
jgi:hypothetical protein